MCYHVCFSRTVALNQWYTAREVNGEGCAGRCYIPYPSSHHDEEAGDSNHRDRGWMPWGAGRQCSSIFNQFKLSTPLWDAPPSVMPRRLITHAVTAWWHVIHTGKACHSVRGENIIDLALSPQKHNFLLIDSVKNDLHIYLKGYSFTVIVRRHTA